MNKTLGKYQLLSVLGRGGMSTVYKALDTQLKREVAVKLLHPHLTHDQAIQERFKREAYIIAQFDHPNVVRIYDFCAGEAGDPHTGEAYLVTEFIRGETLSTFMQRPFAATPLLPECGLAIIQKILQVLSLAHRSGVIHRDLKPDNIMITPEGQLKLMDFGIAHLLEGESLTQTGALIGSPAHMAPEIIEGKACDARSDLFSVGTILYWLLTARMAFQAAHTAALFKQIVTGRYTPVRQHNPLVNAQCAEVVKRLLATSPSERYPSATDALSAVESALCESGITEPAAFLSDYLQEPDVAWQRRIAERSSALKRSMARQISSDLLSEALQCGNELLLLHPGDAQLTREVMALSARLTRRQFVRRIVRSVAAATLLLGLALYGLYHFAAPPHAWVLRMRPFSPALDAAAPFKPQRLSTLEPPGRQDAHAAEIQLPEIKPTEKRPTEKKPADKRPPTQSAAPVVTRSLEVRMLPFGTLYIDDVLVAQETQAPVMVTLAEGAHQLRVTHPYREEALRTLVIPALLPGEAPQPLPPVVIRLERLQPAHLIVNAAAGIEIEIDGQYQGLAALIRYKPIPMTQLQKSVTLRALRDGREVAKEVVTLKAGAQTQWEPKIAADIQIDF